MPVTFADPEGEYYNTWLSPNLTNLYLKSILNLIEQVKQVCSSTRFKFCFNCWALLKNGHSASKNSELICYKEHGHTDFQHMSDSALFNNQSIYREFIEDRLVCVFFFKKKVFENPILGPWLEAHRFIRRCPKTGEWMCKPLRYNPGSCY